MAFDLYDLVTLDAVFRRQRTPTPPFYLNFFNRQINFQTKEIMFDKVFGDDRGLAPFVIPTSQGRPQALDAYTSVAFAPAYVKINDVVDAGMHLERVPGEALGGQLTIEQRRQAVIAELLRKQRIKFQNRNEWLAARALIDGKVTIKGEDYPERLVDFRRDASLTITLAGAAKWDVGTGDPLATLKSARIGANVLSGARITKHIFGANAWDLFNDRVDVKELMNTNFKGLEANITRMSDGYEGQEYMGRIAGINGAGAIEVWVDSSKYIDPDTGAEAFYLDQNTVVGVSEQIQGVRCFGAIMDKRAGYQALDYFFKNYDQENPSLEYLLGQSAPLMVPKNPNASYSVKVA
jgi:hypothetical protein